MSRVQLVFCKALEQSKLPITYISYTWLKASNEAQFECLPIEQWHIYDDVFLCFCESIGLLAISTFAFVPRLVAGFVSKRLLKHYDTKFKCLFKKMYSKASRDTINVSPKKSCPAKSLILRSITIYQSVKIRKKSCLMRLVLFNK